MATSEVTGMPRPHPGSDRNGPTAPGSKRGPSLRALDSVLCFCKQDEFLNPTPLESAARLLVFPLLGGGRSKSICRYRVLGRCPLRDKEKISTKGSPV
ncbi:hypothetical protein NL676_001921 [Syzygium grande]|nr:hypothetical protein NL676_001921 [Syzygium grande]